MCLAFQGWQLAQPCLSKKAPHWGAQGQADKALLILPQHHGAAPPLQPSREKDRVGSLNLAADFGRAASTFFGDVCELREEQQQQQQQQDALGGDCQAAWESQVEAARSSRPCSAIKALSGGD